MTHLLTQSDYFGFPSLPFVFMIQISLLVSSTAFILALYFYFKRSNERSLSKLPLPPGPKGAPIIGNLRDIPTSFAWLTYHKWSKEFSVSPRSYFPFPLSYR